MSQTDTYEEPNMNAPARIKNPLDEARVQVERQVAQWKQALPSHINVEHFQRVVLTLLNTAPNLLGVDRRSLWIACTEAAKDGLLPDRKEGVIVPFKGKAKWMPMYRGLIKAAYNSGEVAKVTAIVVREGDQYRHWIDETGEHFIFEKNVAATGLATHAVGLAWLKDGTFFVEPMSKAEIEHVRASSQSWQDRDSPWQNWPEEMWKKTVIRRMSKRLPMSAEVERVFSRDDDYYDMRAVRDIPDDDDEPKPVKSLEDFGKAGDGRRKPKAEPPKRRGRKPKALKEAEAEPEPAKAEWLDKYRDKLAEADSPEEVTGVWEQFADEYEEASDEDKAAASDAYNKAMDRFEEQPGMDV